MKAEELITYLINRGFRFCGIKKGKTCFATEKSYKNFYLDSLEVTVEDKRDSLNNFTCRYEELNLHDDELFHITEWEHNFLTGFHISEEKIEWKPEIEVTEFVLYSGD